MTIIMEILFHFPPKPKIQVKCKMFKNTEYTTQKYPYFKNHLKPSLTISYCR